MPRRKLHGKERNDGRDAKNMDIRLIFMVKQGHCNPD